MARGKRKATSPLPDISIRRARAPRTTDQPLGRGNVASSAENVIQDRLAATPARHASSELAEKQSPTNSSVMEHEQSADSGDDAAENPVISGKKRKRTTSDSSNVPSFKERHLEGEEVDSNDDINVHIPTNKSSKRRRRQCNKQEKPQDYSLEVHHQQEDAFRKIPNEIMDVIVGNISNVDAVCFALTSKDNYNLISQIKNALPKDVCPIRRRFTAGSIHFRGRDEDKELLRRLALWLPEADILRCFQARKRMPRVVSLKTMLKREKPWMKRWYRQWSYAKQSIVQKCRGIVQREHKRLYGPPSVAPKKKKVVRRGQMEIEWDALVKKSEKAAQNEASVQMVLRSKARSR